MAIIQTKSVIKGIARNTRAFLELSRLKRVADVKPDEIGFFTTGRIGDNVYLLMLSEVIKEFYSVSKLKVVVPDKLVEVAKLWPVDEVIPFSGYQLDFICFSELGHIYGLRRTQRGKLNCAHPGTIEKLSGLDGLNFLTLVKYQVGLSRDAPLRGPKELPNHIYEDVCKRLPINHLSSGIVVSFQSNAIPFDNSEKFKIMQTVLEFFFAKSMTIFFNEHDWYVVAAERYKTHKEFLVSLKGFSLLEIFAITKLCGRAFLIRSGLADLLALTGARVIVYYPTSLCRAYDLNIPCSVHFSMNELRKLNPLISEVSSLTVDTALNFLL